MITYIFGKPGSGKSYKAITLILKELETRPVFSNIELKKYVAGYNYLHQDMMVAWLSFIEQLYIKSQEELIPEEKIYTDLRNRGISDCSIFIDEAHIYGFNNLKKKDFLLFFLALQRHVNLNIFLITQTRKQLHSVFHDFGDVVVTAVSPTERLIASILEYRYFSHVDMISTPKSAYKNEKLKPKKEIFDLYTSGDKNTGDDGFRKKLVFLLFGVLIVVVFMIFQFKSLLGKSASSSDPPILHESSSVNYDSSFSDLNSTSLKDNRYLILNCVSSLCSNNEFKINITVDDLVLAVKDSHSRLLSSTVYSNNFGVVTLLASNDFINLFKGAKNEKNKYNTNNFDN